MTLYRSGAWLLASSALATGLLALAAPAFAADADAEASVDEVVVTGALRSTRLQDAPMAVASIPSEELTNAGFKEPKDLQFISPSVQISIQGANAIYIRGSGTNSQNGGTEQSVGLVLDGVLQGFVDDTGGDLSDTDHVEIYRGPQGTQFAKNASAGVVSIMTKNPVLGEASTDMHFTYGEHNDSSDSVTVNLPISGTMAARLTAGYQYRSGVFENPTLGEKQGGREQKSVRGKLLWQPTEELKILFSADWRRTTETPNFPQAWAYCNPQGPTTPYVNVYGTNNVPVCNGALVGTGIVPSSTNTVIAENQDAFRNTTVAGVSAQIDYDLPGGFTFTSISAYRGIDRFFHSPGNSGVYSISDLDNGYTGWQLSQEFRISSPADKPLTYVAGVFLYDRDTYSKILRSGEYYGQAYYLYPNTPYGRSVRISAEGGQTRTHNVNKSYAAFVDGSYHFTESLLLNAGFRVTHDDVKASVSTQRVGGVFPINVGGALKPPGEESYPKTGYTYRIGPQFFITPDIQIYGTYAHGYKGPLIDTTVNVLNKIKPETVNMFEAGVKSSWFDHRVTLNLTAFHQKFKDYQVNALNLNVTPSVFQLGNAGGMLSKGFELEATARPTPEWFLTGGVTYNDSHYLDYLTSCWNGAEPIKQPTSGPNGCFVRPGSTAASANAVGTPLVNASKWTWRVSANYTHEMGNGFTVDASAGYLHRSSWLSQPIDPNVINPGYGVLNVSAGVTTPDGKYRVGVFARNALDKFFTAGRQPNGGGWTNVLNPESERTIGMTLDLAFGS